MLEGFEVSLAGGAIFLIGLILLLVSSVAAIVAMVVGGLIVFSGLMWTLRSRTRAEREWPSRR